MSRLALGIEYDGSGFSGWQAQTHGVTVQDVIERALTKIAATPIRTHCAGRTDAGVHAIGQVVHFDTPVDRPLSAWVRGVNALLPGGVAVTWAVPVADDFHARFSATSRAYRYLLLNRAQRPGLLAQRVGWYHRPLDRAAMASALAILCGTHDFSSFRAAGCQAKSPVRDLKSATLEERDDILILNLVADGFLHHMIRNIVGALVFIGNGTYSSDWMAQLLAARDRRMAPPTFSPAGLYFSAAHYDEKHGIPQVGFGGTAIVL